MLISADNRQRVSQIREIELEDMQSQFEPTPGPGSYTGMYSKSSFLKHPVEEKFQRMGKANHRWQLRDQLLSKSGRFPGVGQYEPHLLKLSKNTQSFLCKQKRFPESIQRRSNEEDEEASNETPGPGAY